MRPLGRGMFDVYALALPRGHGFGQRLPCEAWQSDDGKACAIVTRHAEDGSIGLIVMRRRTDGVWAVTHDNVPQPDVATATALAEVELEVGRPPLPVPPGVQRRTALYDLQGREPSQIFRLLTARSHQNVAWLLNQLYLSLPRPDANWAADCQTENFHTRLWEAQLLASFREQGLLVTQPAESPDFRIENRRGGVAWVEAVTANPQERFEPVNARPSFQPEEPADLFFGAAALRFAKTLGSKLQRGYADMPHVAGMPFAIALADFHAPASMMWSREALLGYLYGMSAEVIEIDGERVGSTSEASHLLGASGFPAGLFRNDAHAELSAVIFTNACTLGKFNRLAVSAGAPDRGLRYVRYGRFFDRRPGALDGIKFSLDVTSDEYRGLWPQGYEPWCAELEVFHNPFARHPLPEALLPEATHWVDVDDELICRSHYATNILWSGTLIQNQTDDIPSYDGVPAYLESVVAAANGGRYDVDAHLRNDPSATEAFAETHVRRLEAMRRLTGGVTREADGTWIIAPDHLDRATAYEAARAKDRPVAVETLSPHPLEKLIGADAATWLDRELVGADPAPLRDAGFGHDARDALARRRQWLITQGFAEEAQGTTTYRSGMIAALQRRELLRVGAQLSRELGMPFAETEPGARVSGIYRQTIDTMSGRFALVEKSREFTLVPWRPVLDRHVGKGVSGIMRGDGISWSFGRGRSGPGIS